MTLPTKEQVHVTCTSLDCPERKSLCCGARSTSGEKGEPIFVCSQCREEYKGGRCVAEDLVTTPEGKQEWKELLRVWIVEREGYSEKSLEHASQMERFITDLLQAREREVLEWVLRTVDWDSMRPMGDLLKEVQRRLASLTSK